MLVWLITVGEPLPTDNTADRPYRTGLIADYLLATGHKVVWWSSTLDHIRKRQRASGTTAIEVRSGFRLILLRGMTYRRNVSVSRMLNHIQIAREFSRLAPLEAKPDIVLCSLPTLELSQAATQYGWSRRIPVVLDIRDLWPDIFVDLLPKFGHALWKQLLAPMFRMTRDACSKASAIIGITNGLVDWGVRYAARERGTWDRVFAMAYPAQSPDRTLQAVALERWRGLGLEDGKLNICFFGTIGRQFDLDTVIAAARQLDAERSPVRFILCGDGESRRRYERLANGLNSVRFPGWVQRADIWALLQLCQVGLAPYKDSPDFQQSLPQKTIEYMSAGLPVLSSLTGHLDEVLSANKCGLTYGSVDALVQAVLRLAKDRDELARMGRNARELFDGRYRAEHVYKGLVTYLSELAARAPGGLYRPDDGVGQPH